MIDGRQYEELSITMPLIFLTTILLSDVQGPAEKRLDGCHQMLENEEEPGHPTLDAPYRTNLKTQASPCRQCLRTLLRVLLGRLKRQQNLFGIRVHP